MLKFSEETPVTVHLSVAQPGQRSEVRAQHWSLLLCAQVYCTVIQAKKRSMNRFVPVGYNTYNTDKHIDTFSTFLHICVSKITEKNEI